jgi:hypothetical protein
MYQDFPYTKENIAQSLLKRSAELWGYNETNLDQFDPIVRLLTEACSVEFEKTGQEIKETELRLLTRLAEILCPETQRNPKPALAIAQTRPTEARGWVDPENQLVCRQANSRKGEAAEIFFAPAGKHPIVNALVACYATPAGLYLQDKGSDNLLAPVLLRKGGGQSVWIGLDMDPAILSWEGFRFYIDWPADPSRGLYRDFLPFTSWESQGHVLNFEPGLKRDTIQEDLTGIDEHFINLTSADTWEKGKLTLRPYPEEFVGIFDSRSLQALNKPLAWLRIDWPAVFPVAGFDHMKIALNAFPVCNKQLHKVTYRLQPGLNGIALPSAEAFFGINRVITQGNRVYVAAGKQTNGHERERLSTYTLRQQGVGRLDQRNAKAMLYQLMELLRDEVNAFSAIGEDFLASLLREIAQNMARVEQKLGVKRTHETASQPFLVIRADQDPDLLYISYWTTSSEMANGLPAGTKLQPYSSSSLSGSDTVLLTASQGGKPAPDEAEYVRELRKNVVTRGRLITVEDIRIFCLAELGHKISKVNVRPHFTPGTLPGQGFVRCLQVQLSPAAHFSGDLSWVQTCDLLKKKIEHVSTGMYPVQVITI